MFPANDDNHGVTGSQMESDPFEFGPTLMEPCVELCIKELGLRFVGKEGQFRFFRIEKWEYCVSQIFKILSRTGKTKSSGTPLRRPNQTNETAWSISHVPDFEQLRILLLSQEALDICIENAEKIIENGHITRYHIWATASDSPQLWNSQDQINVELEWNRFQNTEPQETTESQEDEYSDMPDWFRDMD